MEALHLAAGLRVVGAGVLVDNAEALQLGLEDHLALSRFAGEDGAVVGEHARGEAVTFRCRVKGFDDIGSLHCDGCGARGEQTGVIVEEVEDLRAAAVGQLPVREVALPHLIGPPRSGRRSSAGVSAVAR